VGRHPQKTCPLEHIFFCVVFLDGQGLRGGVDVKGQKSRPAKPKLQYGGGPDRNPRALRQGQHGLKSSLDRRKDNLSTGAERFGGFGAGAGFSEGKIGEMPQNLRNISVIIWPKKSSSLWGTRSGGIWIGCPKGHFEGWWRKSSKAKVDREAFGNSGGGRGAAEGRPAGRRGARSPAQKKQFYR